MDERSLTAEEEGIIAARVAAQRKMADEYDKREKARKASLAVGDMPLGSISCVFAADRLAEAGPLPPRSTDS